MKKSVCIVALFFPVFINAQTHVIMTAVPFISVPDDAKGIGMGMTGAATTADINSMYWNPAKYSFVADDQHDMLIDYPKDLGFSLALHRSVVKYMEKSKFFLFTAYKTLGKQTIASSFKLFDFGEDILFTDKFGYPLFIARPIEFCWDAAYARKFSQNFSGGFALRFIYSDLTRGNDIPPNKTKPGVALAGDLSLLYRKKIQQEGAGQNHLDFGMNISNIGNKISYEENDEKKDFIPTSFRLGIGWHNQQNIHGFTLAADLVKLLVPTPPSWSDSLDDSGHYYITEGMDDNVSVFRGMYQSFYDAPGGFSEELHEIQWSLGMEYSLYRMIFFRTGYFFEHQTKGGREFINFGAGFKYKFVGADICFSVYPKTSFERYSENTIKNIAYINLVFQIRTRSPEKRND